jgi:hypothetical protein
MPIKGGTGEGGPPPPDLADAAAAK